MPPLLGGLVAGLLLGLELFENFGLGSLDLLFLLGKIFLSLLLFGEMDEVQSVFFRDSVFFTLYFIAFVLKGIKHVLIALFLFNL